MRFLGGQRAPATPSKLESPARKTDVREFGDSLQRRLDYLFLQLAALQILQGVMIVALVKLLP